MSNSPARLLRRDRRAFIQEIEAAFSKNARWAMAVYELDGRTTVVATDAPNRYEVVGALEDLKFDLLEGHGDPEEL